MIPFYSCGISIDLWAINIFAAILKFISNIIPTQSGNELSTGKPVTFFFKTEAGKKKIQALDSKDLALPLICPKLELSH